MKKFIQNMHSSAFHKCMWVHISRRFQAACCDRKSANDACMAAGRQDGAKPEREPQELRNLWVRMEMFTILTVGMKRNTVRRRKIVDLKSIQFILYKCQNKVLNSISMLSPSPPFFQAHPPSSLPSSIHDYLQVWESINASEVITNATKARAVCFLGMPCGQC